MRISAYDLLGLYVTKPDFSIYIIWLHAVILGQIFMYVKDNLSWTSYVSPYNHLHGLEVVPHYLEI